MAFLARQPLKVIIDDATHARQVPRTRVAWRVAAIDAMAAAVALAAAARFASFPFWPALLLATPPAVLQVWHDTRGRGRALGAELAGATALAAVAGAAGLASGRPWPAALSLWAVALILVLPAIVTVRERVQRLHGQPPDWRAPALAHGLAIGGCLALVALRLVPWGLAIVATVLAARAARTLRPAAPPAPAMLIGARELVTGLLASAIAGVLLRHS